MQLKEPWQGCRGPRSLGVLQVCFWKPYGAFHESRAQSWSTAAALVVGLTLSPSPRRICELHRCHDVWGPVVSLTKTLVPKLFGLFRQPTVRRVLLDPNFFHLIIMEITQLLDCFSSGAEKLGAGGRSRAQSPCSINVWLEEASCNSLKLLLSGP